jgi:hypothetical protein
MSLPVYFTCTEQEPQAWGMAGADWPERMAKEYAACGDSRYDLVQDPEKAELIVFWEPFQKSQETWAPKLRAHPLVRSQPNKVFIVTPEDRPMGFLSGLHCSLPRRLFNPKRHRTWIYQGTLNPYIENYASIFPEIMPHRQAAFVGARSHAVRGALFENRALLESQGIFVAETGNCQFNTAPEDATHKEPQLRYIENILKSKFSLCPRGTGTGSFRMQESLALGRAPVILSDDWVPIAGPDWKKCAIFVAERKVRELPAILREREADWQTMGRAARATWLEFFQPKTYARNALRQIEDIRTQRTHDEADYFATWDKLIAREKRRQNPFFRRVLRRISRLTSR